VFYICASYSGWLAGYADYVGWLNIYAVQAGYLAVYAGNFDGILATPFMLAGCLC
jgi:hypothetical protein